MLKKPIEILDLDFLKQFSRSFVNRPPITAHVFLRVLPVFPSNPGALLGPILHTAFLTSSSSSLRSGLPMYIPSPSSSLYSSVGMRVLGKMSAVSWVVFVSASDGSYTTVGILEKYITVPGYIEGKKSYYNTPNKFYREKSS